MQREKVFVLKKIKYGESDLILHCLETHGAKICFLAKGALRSKKRFGGGLLEPTHHLEVVYRKKVTPSNLFLLEEAQMLHAFEGLRLDYDRLELALHFVNLIDQVSHEGTVHTDGLYNLLGHALTQLETSQHLPKLKLHFEVKLYYYLGLLKPVEGMQDFLRLPLKDHSQCTYRYEDVPHFQQVLQQAAHSTGDGD